uniref:ATP synthase complex subunit 8 n=1 Tax=Pedetes capensis TaxID=10023 RepID=T2I4F8_PEDCA|nr:ATP8 [Pedetes capensis]
MPQLDTSKWFITILSVMFTLFVLFQVKLSNYNFPLDLSSKSEDLKKNKTPWELKWTKIYLPHLLPLQ